MSFIRYILGVLRTANGDGMGDIPGITGKIEYLKKLGVNALLICPIYQSPQDDNGYDISDYRTVYPEFGTMEDMKILIQKCQDNDIKIIMDLVVNHTSDEHPWFIEAKKSLDNPYRDYYIWRKGEDGQPPNTGCQISVEVHGSIRRRRMSIICIFTVRNSQI